MRLLCFFFGHRFEIKQTDNIFIRHYLRCPCSYFLKESRTLNVLTGVKWERMVIE